MQKKQRSQRLPRAADCSCDQVILPGAQHEIHGLLTHKKSVSLLCEAHIVHFKRDHFVL